MKKIFAGLLLVTFTAATVPTAPAGDREWATAGKVLTGLVAAQVVCQALNPAPVYVAPAPVYYAPPPAPVYYAPPPAPAYYAPAPAPVYYAPPAPVYYAPAPVYYAPAPVYYAPPVVSFRVGFGFGHYRGHYHHR